VSESSCACGAAVAGFTVSAHGGAHTAAAAVLDFLDSSRGGGEGEGKGEGDGLGGETRSSALHWA